MHSSSKRSPGAALALRISAWVCAILGVLLWMGPALLRADIFSGDATQHVYWLYRYVDPALFPGDLSIEYFGSNSVAPWGYRGLYAALVQLGDALLVSKLVALALLILSVALAWRIGVLLAEQNHSFKHDAFIGQNRLVAGLFAVVGTFILLPYSDLLPNIGFQRTFALPITLLCVWALMTRRYVWAGVSWLLTALVYPIMIAVLGLTAALVFVVDLVRERRMPPQWQWNALLGAAAIALVLLGTGVPEGIGPMISFEQAIALPDFNFGGRQDLYGKNDVYSSFMHHRTGLGWSPKIILGLAIAAAIALALAGRHVIPFPVWALAGTGVGLWFIARLVMFHLYLPNRHSRIALAVFGIVVIAAAAYAVARRFVQETLRTEQARAWVLRALAVVAPLIVLVVLYPVAAMVWRKPVDQDLERAYRFIATLPKDTLVAAHPDLADNVPLRARRSVLASTEESIAFMQGYHRHFAPRIEASLRAAYANDWQELNRLLAPYNVDVVLTGPLAWEKRTYYKPLDALVAQLRAEGDKKGYVLQAPPAERVLFRSGEVYVVRLGGPSGQSEAP